MTKTATPQTGTSTTPAQFWSWVRQPALAKPEAAAPGRFSRPLSARDSGTMEAFGTIIKALRIEADLSTRELGHLVGLSQPSIVNLEAGRQNLEVRLLFDFAEAFELPAIDLFARLDRALAAIESNFKSNPAQVAAD